MEPTPPKGARLNKKFNRPFYEASQKTSAEIVSEARSSLRVFHTKRPFTPADSSRKLFSGHAKEGRPPSSCSVPLSFIESRPPTGRRLSPIQSTLPDLKDLGKKLKPESPVKPRKLRLSRESSRDNNNNNSSNNNSDAELHEDDEQTCVSDDLKAIKSRDVTNSNDQDCLRVNSGPKERTSNIDFSSLKKRSSSSGDIYKKSRQQEASENKSTYFTDNIKPLLRQMELNHLHGDEDSLIVNFDVLWKTLEIGDMLGKSKLGSKRRQELLSSVYKCTSGDNVILLLKLSRLFLTLEVSGKNLEVVCKLMLKVSRDKQHDELFLSEGLLVLLMDLLKVPYNLDMTNCLVYLTGAIKFLSMNAIVLKEMIKHDVLKSISCLLQHTLSEYTTDDTRNRESCHMLIQVTSALVNFANIDELKEKFISYGIVQQVINLTETRYTDSDFFMDVARLLSKLTMDEQVCHEISKLTSNYGILYDALKCNYRKSNITVRICYAFGNIANYCVDMRSQLAFDYNGIEVILKVADYYLRSLAEHENSTKEIQDVLVKVVRIVANLSIEERCGIAFSNSEDCNNMLCRIIDQSEKKHMSDELLISFSVTLNNLSYYAQSNSIFMENLEHFALGMVDMLLSENIACLTEAMRVLGNLTRSKLVCSILVNDEVFDILIGLLDSNNSDVIFCTCGVLVNLMIDDDNRSQLKKFGGITKLINILKEFAETHWLLAGLICQIFWNFSKRIVISSDCFGTNENDDLITILNELIEPELALDYESQEDLDDSAIEILKESWSINFQPVASQLLKRIESHHSDLIPIVSLA